MAKNFVQVADVIDADAGATAVPSGGLLNVGVVIGIAITDIPVNGSGPIQIRGAALCETASGQTIAKGDSLNYTSARVLTKAAAGSGGVTGAALALAPAAAGQPVVALLNPGGQAAGS